MCTGVLEDGVMDGIVYTPGISPGMTLAIISHAAHHPTYYLSRHYYNYGDQAHDGDDCHQPIESGTLQCAECTKFLSSFR